MIKKLYKAGTDVADVCEATGICRKIITVYSAVMLGMCAVVISIPCYLYGYGKGAYDTIKNSQN